MTTTSTPTAPATVTSSVDFWHSATFSWDGKVINFIDESFGTGCPTVTPNVYGRGPGDTGAMFFLSTKSGEKLSQFTYWYEGPGLGSGQFPVYGTDGVEDPPTGECFQVFSLLSDVTTEPLAYLNPQTQERTLGGHGFKVTAKKAGRYRSASTAKADARAGSSQEVVRHLAP